MNSTEHLTQTERDELLKNLNEKQKMFVQNYLKRGRKTVFANLLAKEKAGSVEENQIEDVASQWELLDYIDAGPDWQTRSELHCECGRPLRYQYIVHNKGTGEIRKFGIKHFEEHTGIPPQLVKDIVKGIEKIDFEMDEILLKNAQGWTLVHAGIETIPAAIDIPKDIQQHFDAGVPLLDRQVQRLRERIADYLREEKRKQLEAQKAEQEQAAQKKRELVSQRRHAVAEKMGAAISHEIPLDQHLQLGVLVYLDLLRTSQFSANDVCEDLIKNHGASQETYSSGRLLIFPKVCMYLEFLVSRGKLELVEKQGVEDRIYRIINLAMDDIEAGEEEQHSQQRLFDL
ncbi:DUF3895 domain-containing protein [Salinibacillus xinjiangensis]|uniref:DUF3895 domain-containing protein n=1 Tax=Salinibacillus xinjiangensis TaxID=1229268 RepID=A0A6G1X531_9BACI|nr:DUF3895 domain-containing protein [Salinibacillus xinjiangensis]MRG85938.1 DUF3895 domain-containing protein [Salinibacillus xinjiangensis]